MGEVQEGPPLRLLSSPSRAPSPWVTRVSLSPPHSPGLGRGQPTFSTCQDQVSPSGQAEHTSRPRGLAWEAPSPSGQLPGSQT